MNITYLKPIGYCFGVINAINESLKIKKQYPNKNIYVFGELVHNKDVIKLLNNNGIITLNVQNNELDLLNSFTEKDIVIFTAHGHNKKFEEILNNNKITFFDTTCKNVSSIFKIINQNLDRGVIYIGKKDHPETKAALSISNKVLLYDLKDKINYDEVQFKNPIVLNQTTLSFIELKSIHEELKEHIKNIEIIDEVCPVTRIRQESIINLAKKYDLIIIVGASNSSNTNKLYELALKYHSHAKIIKVNNVEEVRSLDLSNYKETCLASGTSTPLTTINDIKDYLERTYNYE